MGIKEKMVSGCDDEVTESAVRICRGYLNGPWKKITNEDVIVKRLSGGLSNFLFHVKLEGCDGAKPQQVLLRLYGQTHGEGAIENLITESVIFTLLSERKIGPKLYGVFPGGRIEEFIPAQALSTADLHDEAISIKIAEKLAAVHLMNIPISKEPRWIWDTMDRWLMTIEKHNLTQEHPRFFNANLRDETKWLKNHLRKIRSPVVFCHNDLQEGNILNHRQNGSDSLVFIDFEYCAYNYRGFDFANHFIERTYDYTCKEFPYFSVHKEYTATKENIQSFFEKYLESLYKAGGVSNPEANNINSMLREVKHFTLATHLFWTLWSIVNARGSPIPFGYWEYAIERFSSYEQLKDDILLVKDNTPIKRKVIE